VVSSPPCGLKIDLGTSGIVEKIKAAAGREF